MTDTPNPILLDKVITFCLQMIATKTLKPLTLGVLREHVLELTDSASPALRRRLLEEYEAAFEYVLHDYLIERHRGPQAVFVYGESNTPEREDINSPGKIGVAE